MGHKTPRAQVQRDDLDTATRNRLWTVFSEVFLSAYFRNGNYAMLHECGRPLHVLFKRIWDQFFKLPMDDLPYDTERAFDFVRAWFFDKARWNELLDFLEFVADQYEGPPPTTGKRTPNARLVAGCNKAPDRGG